MEPTRSPTRRIVSWNVNGLRACVKKGFLEFLEASGADLVGIQELRATPDQLTPEVRAPTGWHAFFSPAVRKGYSGVAIFTRQAPTRIETALGIDAYDVEGRSIIAHFGRFAIANAYFPKGSGKDRDNSRVPYKLGFYQALFERLQQLRRRGPVLIMGDYNTAHTRTGPRTGEIECQDQRIPTRRTRRTRPLDRRRVDRHVPAAASRGRRPLHLVAAVGQCPRGQRRLAHRLRLGIAVRPKPGRRCLHLARRDGLGPLPRRCRRAFVNHAHSLHSMRLVRGLCASKETEPMAQPQTKPSILSRISHHGGRRQPSADADAQRPCGVCRRPGIR